MATNSEAGLVKIGNNEKATGTLDEEHGWHPVQLNNDNQAYVHVSRDAELWKKLYPTDFFKITPINSDNDNFWGCTINIPKIIRYINLSYCSFSQKDLQEIKHKGIYIPSNGYLINIPEADHPINKNQNSYIFLEAITDKGHFNLVLKIIPADLAQQNFNASII